eukprot:m.720105 g.720105  ORF g.720105 m.720105 type:complete len:87 (+) comp23003_c0_seq10:45-305(+)
MCPRVPCHGVGLFAPPSRADSCIHPTQDGELQRTHDDIRAFQDVFRRDFAVFLQRVEAAIASEQQAQIADVRLNQSIPEFDRGASR